jgi:hypothetical protein
MVSNRSRSLGLLAAVALAGACSTGSPEVTSPGATTPGGTAATETATVRPTATPRPTRSPRPTAEPAPSGLLLLPTAFAEALPPGTYWSAPPFNLGFAFTVAEEGWVAGHLNAEFVDLQQFDGVPAEGVEPDRIIGFGHPLVIHGADVVPAAELTPAEAVQLWVDRSDIEATNVSSVELLGGDAVRVDVHAPISMLPLFGGDDGTFRLDGDDDVRLVVRAIPGGLFMASVHAVPDDLDAAWAAALPVLESIDLGD